MPLASPATEPKRHWLSLPLWHPAGGQGGLPRAALAIPATVAPGGGVAVLVARLPFTLALFLPPSPRPPSQREGGDSKFSYARGFAPCIPGAEPARHLQNPPSRCPEWGFAPCGAGMVAFRYPCNRVGRGTGTTIGIRSFYRKSKGICLFMDSAGSQGEGGPGERNFGV